MLDRLGIRSRVLLLALLPAGLMALVLGSYFTWLQQNDLRTQLLQRGKMIAEQLAPLAAPAMARLAPAQLERIAAQTLEQSDVRSVAFLAPDRTRLAHAGPSMLNQPPSGGTGTQLLQRSGNDATRYLMPVFGHHRDLATEAVPAEAERLLGWVEIELSHDGTLLRGYRNLFTSLLLILACLVLSGLLALRMSRSINDPIERIKHAVNQLKDGHLEERLPTMGSHELDELARGINRMAETLHNAHEELQHSIDQATEDVRQNLETIEIQNIELDMARKEALEASRIKSEFLANMSHEIRTPLNGILGFTHLLQKSEMTPRQLDYLSTIEKSADNLLGIINEILDFSKIEAGKLVLDSIPFNLRDLIQDTLTILAPAAHAKQLELLSLVYRDTPTSLVGDPLRLKQILTNLVSNAIKFTREGTIVVRAMLDDEHEDHAQLRISVQDTGIGLSPQDVRTLFQAFSQADNSLARQPGGTGLGLVISKRLIEQMGGEIGVDSTPGEGSQFWISLNLPKAHDDIEELPLQALLGRRAAIVDNHELARQALEHQLQDCGLSVSLFATYDQLLQAVQAASQAGQPGRAAIRAGGAGRQPGQPVARTTGPLPSTARTLPLPVRGAVPDHRAGAVPPLPAQWPWPVAVQAYLHAQIAPAAAGAGPAPPPAGRGEQPQRPAAAENTVCRRQPCEFAAGADAARGPGCRSTGGRQWLCGTAGRAAGTLRPGADGCADARHGRPRLYRTDSPLGKHPKWQPIADRRPHRPCHGQRETRIAARRHG